MTRTSPFTVDRERLAAATSSERERFARAHPRCAALHERARASLLDGVPMNWMSEWASPFPLFVDEAAGARFTCVDGDGFVDLCLGDTGAMAGHGPAATIAAVERQLRRGITHMLPTEDAIAAGEELARRFGLPLWQFTMTATDANRFSIRLARRITGRPKVVVHDFCYHGSVDETLATLDPDGRVVATELNIGPPVEPALTSRVVPFNDVVALSAVGPGTLPMRDQGTAGTFASGSAATALWYPLTGIGDPRVEATTADGLDLLFQWDFRPGR
jgi:glutamate-1-semialdehyde aminotransferase